MEHDTVSSNTTPDNSHRKADLMSEIFRSGKYVSGQLCLRRLMLTPPQLKNESLEHRKNDQRHVADVVDGEELSGKAAKDKNQSDAESDIDGQKDCKCSETFEEGGDGEPQ
jgi:hypothetical protein